MTARSTAAYRAMRLSGSVRTGTSNLAWIRSFIYPNPSCTQIRPLKIMKTKWTKIHSWKSWTRPWCRRIVMKPSHLGCNRRLLVQPRKAARATTGRSGFSLKMAKLTIMKIGTIRSAWGVDRSSAVCWLSRMGRSWKTSTKTTSRVCATRRGIL